MPQKYTKMSAGKQRHEISMANNQKYFTAHKIPEKYANTQKGKKKRIISTAISNLPSTILSTPMQESPLKKITISQFIMLKYTLPLGVIKRG